MIINFPAPRDSGDPEDATYDGPPIVGVDGRTVYTLLEVAYLLDIPVADARAGLEDGTLPGLRVDDEWFVGSATLWAWLEEQPTEGGERW